MIKINLLPKQKRAQVSDIEKELVLFVFGLLIFIACLGGAYFFMEGSLDDLRTQKQIKQAELNRLRARIGNLKKIERELEAMKTKVKIIRQIRERQDLPIRFLDELVSTIPPSRLWFEAFSMSGGGIMDIRGVCLDNQAFASFVDDLRKSDYIAWVKTLKTSRRSVQGLALVEFQCQIQASAPKKPEEKNG